MRKITQPENIPLDLEAPLTFERALAELEAIVNQMETSELPLEQSLSEYKRGTVLLQFCQKSLADIEQQVRILNEANQLQPYSISDD
jgi:exodeoxyribonuclease VII small subunit